MLKYQQQKKINNNKTLLTFPVCITTGTTKDCMTPNLEINIDPLTPMNGQDRISPYSIKLNTISTR